MGYLGDKVKKIHKMGVKVVDSVTKFGEKHKGKLAVAGMVGLGYNPNRVAWEGWDTVFGGVTAGTARGKLLHNMSFYVQVDPDSDNDWRWVSGSAIVSDELQSENLLGTGHISDLKSGYTIQFV